MSLSRLFTFGCSFTNYHWPTWADILGQDYSQYYNLGRSGAGNLYIACQLSEAVNRYNITDQDRVIIQWSSPLREDRYTDQWLTWGNVFEVETSPYPQDWVRDFVTEKGCLVRDLALISLCKNLLDGQGIDYSFFAMTDLDQDADVTGVYQKTLASIKPSMQNSIFDGQWPNRTDPHPWPGQYLDYLVKTINYSPSDIISAAISEITDFISANQEVSHGNYQIPRHSNICLVKDSQPLTWNKKWRQFSYKKLWHSALIMPASNLRF